MKEINMKNIMTAWKSYNIATENFYSVRHYSPDDDEKTTLAADRLEKFQDEFLQVSKKATTVINDVQKRCTARTICISDIASALEDVENRLNISKKAMEGITATVDCNAQHFPSAYRFIPESTIFTAEYRRGSWRITDIYRDRTKSETRGTVITLTEEAKKAVLDRLTVY